LTGEFGAAVRSNRNNDQPNERGIATMKLTTMTQVTVDGTQTTDPEAGR
jgi:hypothetical protein